MDQKRLQAQQAKQAPSQKQGWMSWALGYSATEEPGSDGMTNKQRQELYVTIDYKESDKLAAGLIPPWDIVRAQISAQLCTGSLSLHRGSAAKDDVISIIFDDFTADVIQCPDNLDATLTLGGMHVHDGTMPGTLYPDIRHMKNSPSCISNPTTPKLEDKIKTSIFTPNDPFFYVKFEHNPLDERADNALTLKMKVMEVIYHHGYLKEIFAFLKPPESQLESVAALLETYFLQ